MYKFRFEKVRYKVVDFVRTSDYVRLPDGRPLKVTFIMGETLSVVPPKDPVPPGARVLEATVAHDAILPKKEKKQQPNGQSKPAKKSDIYTFIRPHFFTTYKIDREPWRGMNIQIGEFPDEIYVEVLNFDKDKKTCTVWVPDNRPSPDKTVVKATEV